MSTSWPFALFVGGRPLPFRLLSGRGRERLGKPYRFDLEIAVDATLDVRELLRKTARLELVVGEHVRCVGGLLDRVESGAPLRDGLRHARLRLRPLVSKLARRRDSRVFQSVSSLEIAATILAEHGVPLEIVASPSKKRDVCIQHEETDLALVTRVLAEDGISFFFAQPASGEDAPEKIVLFDAARGYRPLEGGPLLRYRALSAEGQALVQEEDHVTAFGRRVEARPTSAATREFDFQRPRTPVTAAAVAASAAAPREEWFAHHGPYGETQPGLDAALLLGRQNRRADTAVGRALSPRLSVGRKFTLGDHFDAALDGEWALVEVEHDLAVEASGDAPRYACTFVCVPADRFLAPRLAPRATHQSLETATVVGPGGEEIYTDEHGRIKVLFHWDRLGPSNENASCWVRVVQPWAGALYGHQFIPRIGMEVLIAFLGGDLDRPMCIGALPNATHAPPFALPIERTRSGIKTHSVGAKDGYNELSFEDSGGGEEVRLRAQRNLSVHVLNDANEVVDQHATQTVGGDLHVSVGGGHHVRVTGPSVSVFASDTQSTHGGQSSLAVAGDYEIDVAANRHAKIAGADTTEIGGDRVEYVKGALTVRADSRHVLLVGNHLVEGVAEIHSTGQIVVGSDRDTRLVGGETFTIQCGDSSIELTPSKIVLRSPEIELRGSKSVTATGAGPSISLKDKAEVVSDELRLLTKSASLELGEEAKLKGKSIAMSTGQPKPEAKDDDAKKETDPFSLTLTDEKFAPYAGKKFEAHCGGQKLEGSTDGGGKVALDLPKGAKQLLLSVWIDDYPTGRRKEIAIQLGDLPPIDAVPGVQTRLKNLGYYAGTTDGDRIDGPTADALRDFQKDHDLEPTAQLDDATKSALAARYGH